MKNYIEIQRNTDTFAQFLAQCRAALRKHPAACYASWADYVDGAREEMNEIEAGKREKYYSKHNADDERPFDEICAASATSYQIYLNRKDERAFYNFILEWEDGHGYFYCVDCMAEEQTQAAIEPEKKEEVLPVKRYELTPNNGRKSFYGKAHVEIEDNGTETLYSYNTPIIRRNPAGELVRLWDGWSATTGRHIAAFCGIGKADYMNLKGA